MLVAYQKEVNPLKIELNNKTAAITKKLAEIIISYSAYLPKLLNAYVYKHKHKRCNLCSKIDSCFEIAYGGQFDNPHNSLMLCLKGYCYSSVYNKLRNVNCEFIYKKMLTGELSEIGDINTHIFKLFLRLYREIEI